MMLLKIFFLNILLLWSTTTGKPWHARSGGVQGWKQRFHASCAQNVVNPKDVRVAFLGDSITYDWTKTGQAVWNSAYRTKGAYNYGISSDCTQQILWRLQNGQFHGLIHQPKLIVLMIGTNNIEGVPLNCEKASGNETALAVQAIVEEIQRRFPQTKILLIGILPRHHGGFGAEILNANNGIMKIANNNSIHYMDMTPQFQHSPTQQKTDLYQSDILHLSETGYKMWQQTMHPLFDALNK